MKANELQAAISELNIELHSPISLDRAMLRASLEIAYQLARLNDSPLLADLTTRNASLCVAIESDNSR